ncbi:hypothetical protein QBC38DRAFT_530960 [Podospora fimiseda]|uniref:Heterokaryon incompatibility domain-containing protein n=1 Tax=Podospora fimiseda TaxID=252190 RepID=A0AAN7BKZ9_9PEZI|nr:hypothetical protein QBC38DRAFT_530960 [Podospora fimiseda]
MRLINTKTFKVEEFLEQETPPYAILSHTWAADEEEINFQDAQEGNITNPGVGSIKLRGSCRQAIKDGLNYVWIDTCCIDKRNLVELSEAINSMFRWYKRASFCYAYMADVPDNDTPREPASRFRSSRWFTRGWTLQELLAPKYVRFYDSSWNHLGNKGTMASILEEITGIPRQHLQGITRLHHASVAQRMAWTAKRNTKRPEDLAYCLLGIFGVSMPMIYGEGGNQAFLRLQEHIMRTTRDDSMLAWGLKDSNSPPLSDDVVGQATCRVMATTPANFIACKHIVSRQQPNTPSSSLKISGGSLGAFLPLVAVGPNKFIALLNCGPESNASQRVGMPLVKTDLGASNEYARPASANAVLYSTTESCPPPQPLYIKNDTGAHTVSLEWTQNFWLFDHDAFAELGLELTEVFPKSCWDQERAVAISADTPSDDAARQTLARFRQTDQTVTKEEVPDFLLLLGLKDTSSSTEAKFHYHLAICSRTTRLEEIAEKKEFVEKRGSKLAAASNGQIHIQVTLKAEHGNSIFIKPEKLSKPPPATVDLTVELKRLGLMVRLDDLRKETDGLKAEMGEVANSVQARDTRLKQLKEERETVEEKIRRLKKQRQKLVDREGYEAYRVKLLREREGAIIENIAHSRSQIQRTGKEFHQLFNDIPFMVPNPEDCSLLLRGAISGCVEMVAFCLNQKADKSLTDSDVKAAFTSASMDGFDSVVQQFLVRGVDVNITDPDGYGYTPLVSACMRGRTSVAEMLLKTGTANVNVQDKKGWTPLRWAVERGRVAIAELLLQANANVAIEAKDGLTPLSAAILLGKTEFISLLQDKGKERVPSVKDRGTTARSTSLLPVPTKSRQLGSNGEQLERSGAKSAPSSPSTSSLQDTKSNDLEQKMKGKGSGQLSPEVSTRPAKETSPTGSLLRPPPGRSPIRPSRSRSHSPDRYSAFVNPRATPPIPTVKRNSSQNRTGVVFDYKSASSPPFI